MSLAPSTTSAALRTSSAETHTATPSVAADASGFTTTGYSSRRSAQATISSGSELLNCSAQRTPARRSASIISYLSRRARQVALALPGRPSSSLSRSVHSTPGSCPVTTATGENSASARAASSGVSHTMLAR